jgi:MFS family permease
MPASRALNADLVPEHARGKLFGRMAAFFSVGAVLGPILSTWLYAAYKNSVFRFSILGNVALRGEGLPFVLSSIIGLISLFLLLVFVKEPKSICSASHTHEKMEEKD